MFKKLQRKALAKTCEKLSLNRDLSEINAQVKRIGFLVNEDEFDQLEIIRQSATLFTIEPKDIRVFSFVTFSKKAPSLRQDQLTNKDFSWKGGVTSENAKEFLEQPWDMLVGFYAEKNPYLDIMVAQSKAKFKVGVAKANPEIFDLLVDVAPTNFNRFATELKKYLIALKKI